MLKNKRKPTSVGKFGHSAKTSSNSHYFLISLFLFIFPTSVQSFLILLGRGWERLNDSEHNDKKLQTIEQSSVVEAPPLESLQADKDVKAGHSRSFSEFSQWWEALSGSFPSLISRNEHIFHMTINQFWVQQTCPTIPKYNTRNPIINHPISSGNITELLKASTRRGNHRRSTSQFSLNIFGFCMPQISYT